MTSIIPDSSHGNKTKLSLGTYGSTSARLAERAGRGGWDFKSIKQQLPHGTLIWIFMDAKHVCQACCGACLLQLNDPVVDGAAEAQTSARSIFVITCAASARPRWPAAAASASVSEQGRPRLSRVQPCKPCPATEGFPFFSKQMRSGRQTFKSAFAHVQLSVFLSGSCLVEAACTSSTSGASKFGPEWRTPVLNAACASAASASTASSLASAGTPRVQPLPCMADSIWQAGV